MTTYPVSLSPGQIGQMTGRSAFLAWPHLSLTPFDSKGTEAHSNSPYLSDVCRRQIPTILTPK